jgi:hypothetical protein
MVGVYRNQSAVTEQTVSHIAAQSPNDRSTATVKPAPGANFVAVTRTDRGRLRSRLRLRNFGIG